MFYKIQLNLKGTVFILSAFFFILKPICYIIAALHLRNYITWFFLHQKVRIITPSFQKNFFILNRFFSKRFLIIRNKKCKKFFKTFYTIPAKFYNFLIVYWLLLL